MNHYDKIDGLRCVAISLVLLEHFAMFIGRPLYAGFYGVDLFFVISGFLVTEILMKSKSGNFKQNYIRFLGRRTLRIFPIYYLAIAILLLLGLPVVKDNLIFLLTYTFNYAVVFKSIPTSPVNHFWSLCVEEQFYLFWPLVVFLFRDKRLYMFSILILIICVGYLQQSIGIFPSLIPYNYFSILTRMASLGIGALGALFCVFNVLPHRLLNSKALEYAAFLVLLATLVVNYHAKVMVLGICSLFLVLKAARYSFHCTAVENFLNHKTVIYIGTISYGIYIYHLPIDFYFTRHVFDPVWTRINFDSFGCFSKIRWHSWIIKLPLYSFFSVFVARLSHKYIESPILMLKNRYFV